LLIARAERDDSQEDELADMAEEAAISGLYGGIHFRTTMRSGSPSAGVSGRLLSSYHVPSP
jgi:hypothetical protein